MRTWCHSLLTFRPFYPPLPGCVLGAIHSKRSSLYPPLPGCVLGAIHSKRSILFIHLYPGAYSVPFTLNVQAFLSTSTRVRTRCHSLLTFRPFYPPLPGCVLGAIHSKRSSLFIHLYPGAYLVPFTLNVQTFLSTSTRMRTRCHSLLTFKPLSTSTRVRTRCHSL